jgi:hypothetical protein
MSRFATTERKDPPDERAIERYHYMLRTAPPDAIEQAHAEAFAQLSPSQRRQVLEQLSRAVSPAERAYLHEDPRSLARVATKAEVRNPGMLEQLFGSVHGGAQQSAPVNVAGALGGSLLASVAGTFIGSAVARSFFNTYPFDSYGYTGYSEMASEGLPETADFEFGGGFDDAV